MAPSKLRRALGAFKDQTSIGLAKVGGSSSLSDLRVAILKATRHEEFPAEEKHIREILSLTCYSRAHISACVNIIAKRLNKTKNWTVALKTLMLVQRLLAEGDPAYEQEIFFSTRRGTRLLNMAEFRDTSRSHSWDYSAIVRTYALYLDERLEYRMQGRRGKRSMYAFDDEEEETGQATVRDTPLCEMKTEQVYSRMQHLQQLLERFLACRPTGEAKNKRVVFAALYPIVKESFQIYYEMTETLTILVDHFVEMEIPNCVKVYEAFARIGKQFDELEAFYEWCKDVGLARSSEYPEVEKITQKKLDLMDEAIRERLSMAQGKKAQSVEQQKTETMQEPSASEVVEDTGDVDMASMKALPPPEGFTTESTNRQEANKEDKKESVQPAEADLLNLGDDSITNQEQHGNQLALALFNGSVASTGRSPTPTPSWEAFSEDTVDWETALVQSASNLSKQEATLGGGLDMLLLDSMYQHGAAPSANIMGNNAASLNNGSASSVAIASGASATARPQMLALPAPQQAASARATFNSLSADPFAASLTVAPPPYVQMSDMEKKQRLLVDEQIMWQQYARNGMQGQHAISQFQANPYAMGGFMRTY